MSTKKERDLTAIHQAEELEQRIRAAVQADYPDLAGYMMQRNAIVRTGAGENDWRWDSSVSGRAKRARKFAAEAVSVAASRISAAYGLGAGREWAARHFGAPGDESAAIAGHTG